MLEQGRVAIIDALAVTVCGWAMESAVWVGGG